jgi:hypothetical protein
MDPFLMISAMARQSRHLVTNVKEVDDVRITPFIHSASKQCFNNAAKYIMKLNFSQRERSKYVLGYIILNGGIPIEHAWVELDGKHLEVTLDTIRGKYIEIYRATFTEISDYIHKHGCSPSLYELNNFKK